MRRISKDATGKGDNQDYEPDGEQLIAELMLYMVAINENFEGPRILACWQLMKKFLFDDGTLESRINEILEARERERNKEQKTWRT